MQNQQRPTKSRSPAESREGRPLARPAWTGHVDAGSDAAGLRSRPRGCVMRLGRCAAPGATTAAATTRQRMRIGVSGSGGNRNGDMKTGGVLGKVYMLCAVQCSLLSTALRSTVSLARIVSSSSSRAALKSLVAQMAEPNAFCLRG